MAYENPSEIYQIVIQPVVVEFLNTEESLWPTIEMLTL